jgi:hypothetical protein
MVNVRLRRDERGRDLDDALYDPALHRYGFTSYADGGLKYSLYRSLIGKLLSGPFKCVCGSHGIATKGPQHSFQAVPLERLRTNLVRGLYHFVRTVTAGGPAMRLDERTAQRPATRRFGYAIVGYVHAGSATYCGSSPGDAGVEDAVAADVMAPDVVESYDAALE